LIKIQIHHVDEEEKNYERISGSYGLPKIHKPGHLYKILISSIRVTVRYICWPHSCTDWSRI